MCEVVEAEFPMLREGRVACLAKSMFGAHMLLFSCSQGLYRDSRVD